MGYYDPDNQEMRRYSGGSKKGYFFTGLIGAIIGALLVVMLTGYTNDTNTNNSANNNTTENKTIANTTGKNVSVNISSAVTEAVEKTSDAVVGISNIQQNTSNFFGTEQQSEDTESGSGSGVIYKKEDGKAFIVTNYHVVEGANSLEVTLADGSKVDAKLVGSDQITDLAVITIDDKNIKNIAEFGDSDSIKTGEPVIAIGNPLGLQFSGSVTQGIVSGLNRTIPIDYDQNGVVDWNTEVIQTDAAINPGNSGGALINLDGQVIGINSMKIATGEVEGIGLSIPINTVQPVISDIEQYGKVKRPYMGTGLQSLSDISTYHLTETLLLPKDITEGVAVTEVGPNTPAAKAGMKQLDVIVEMDGQKVTDVPSLRKILYQDKKIGDKLKIKFYREGKLQNATITLGEIED